MIHWDVEKALHLLGVEIHRQHAIHPGGIQQISDELRRDWNARLILAVLARVTKKWNDSCDPVSAGAARRINHDQKFH